MRSERLCMCMRASLHACVRAHVCVHAEVLPRQARCGRVAPPPADATAVGAHPRPKGAGRGGGRPGPRANGLAARPLVIYCRRRAEAGGRRLVGRAARRSVSCLAEKARTQEDTTGVIAGEHLRLIPAGPAGASYWCSGGSPSVPGGGSVILIR